MTLKNKMLFKRLQQDQSHEGQIAYDMSQTGILVFMRLKPKNLNLMLRWLRGQIPKNGLKL